MIPELDHIGIAVANLQDVINTMKNVFNADPDFLEDIADQKVRIAGYNNGNVALEYLEPTSEDSSISKFLQKRGNGIHHIALRVQDLEKKLAELDAKGIRLIDRKARNGADNKKIAFLHPDSCNGILIELCEFE
jgi:methylmalonyl-CoA/ethylmalonyl-CoA epimerase